MKPPTISQAQRIAEALGARGVIILAFGDGNYAGSSYGETRAECREVGKTLDGIVDGIATGRVYPPVVQDGR